MIESKNGQRLAGLPLFVLGAGGTAWSWQTALAEGYYYPKAAAVFPKFVVFGLGMILFPIDVDEFRAKHGVEKIQTFRQWPLAWKILAAVAVAAAFGNWFAMSQLS